MGESWQPDAPDCFGTENKNNLECAKCEVMHDCLFLRSIKITEKMVSGQTQSHAQPAGQPMQFNIIPMADVIKQQSELFWGTWKSRIDKLIASGFLKEMMAEIQKQGFTKEESFSIMIKII